MMTDGNIYIIIAFIFIFFAIQRSLCIKVNSIMIKLIPVYIIILAFIIAVSAYTAGGLTSYVICVFSGGFIGIPGLIGVVAAWIVWLLQRK